MHVASNKASAIDVQVQKQIKGFLVCVTTAMQQKGQGRRRWQ